MSGNDPSSAATRRPIREKPTSTAADVRAVLAGDAAELTMDLQAVWRVTLAALSPGRRGYAHLEIRTA